MFYVYDSDYDEMAFDPFDSINEAAMYILSDLPHEDFLYMIGTGDGIDATVFQGLVYYPEANVAGMFHARAEATLASCNRARQAAEAECERLRNMLNTDSQMFTIECSRAEVDLLRAEVDRLRAIVVAAYNTGLPISGVDLRSALGVETDSELN